MDTSAPINPTNFALWSTQGGGLARWDQDRELYIWHELPEWYAQAGITEQVGDPIPREWDLIPANDAARDEACGPDEEYFI